MTKRQMSLTIALAFFVANSPPAVLDSSLNRASLACRTALALRCSLTS